MQWRREPVRGRGATGNPPGRFESIWTERDPEWDAGCGPDDEAPAPSTRFYRDISRRVLSHNDSPDIPYDSAVNPYRGCEHGCIYCYARPTHEMLGFSCGLDFETKIMVKQDAPALLRRELLSPRWQPRPIAIGSACDPYQPVERRLKITRGLLQVLCEFRNPVMVTTKNRLITRDADLLAELASYKAACVTLSVTTLDAELARIMEPRTSPPALRLQAVRDLRTAGVPCGVMMAPVVPGLTDHEILAVVEAAAEAGALWVGWQALRLPYQVKDLFQHWLEAHLPQRKEKVLNRIRDMRGGRLNETGFGQRMRGRGIWADLMEQQFDVAVRKAGLSRRGTELSTAAFRRPQTQAQLSLF